MHITQRSQDVTVTLDGTSLRLAPGAPVDFGDPQRGGLVPITVTVLADRLRFEHTSAAPTPQPATPDAASAAPVTTPAQEP